MSDGDAIKLRIPRQDLDGFPLFKLTPKDAQTWVGTLPLSHPSEVAQKLHRAFGDLNRVDMAPDLRFEIMEALRPTLSMCLAGMSKRYLNQPVVLPEEPRKISRLALSLHELQCLGYTITAIHCIQRRKTVTATNPAKLVCHAIHRAITSSSQKILLTYQLYQPADALAWSDLHQLFMLAERQRLHTQVVKDELTGDGSITDAYLRVLMLGCSKPNQLRQRDLNGVFRGLSDWVQMLRMHKPEEGQGLFLVDMSADHPPLYGSLYGTEPGANTRMIDTDALVEHMETLQRDNDERGIVYDQGSSVSQVVMEHLAVSWGVMSKRNFARAPGQERMWVSVGLDNSHYYISGGTPFEDLTRAENELEVQVRQSRNPFIGDSNTGEAEIWERAFSASAKSTEAGDVEYEIREAEHILDDAKTERHPVFPVRLHNVSPGGYCLQWSSDITELIKTGDLISVREIDNTAWSIAVIRWVNQLSDETTLLGVELLSPRATPFGASVLHKTGDESEPMRALLLPEIKLVGQPNTLITPKSAFKERQKVKLMRLGENTYVQLHKKVSSTATYVQFEFRSMQHLEEVVAADAANVMPTEFYSVWDNI
ncbi:MAG: hypothetical protein ACI9GW_000619 [Halieaceae bacterium]|jgi:hypothetical protein